jgi:ClpP class serine protease
MKSLEDGIMSTYDKFNTKCEIIEIQTGHIKDTFDTHVKLNDKEHGEFKTMIKNIQDIKELVIKIVTKMEEAEKK